MRRREKRWVWLEKGREEGLGHFVPIIRDSSQSVVVRRISISRLQSRQKTWTRRVTQFEGVAEQSRLNFWT